MVIYPYMAIHYIKHSLTLKKHIPISLIECEDGLKFIEPKAGLTSLRAFLIRRCKRFGFDTFQTSFCGLSCAWLRIRCQGNASLFKNLLSGLRIHAYLWCIPTIVCCLEICDDLSVLLN